MLLFDKTNYIEELLKDRTEIKLFTRPRRFGKTLNMTTLKYFFDVRNAEENKKTELCNSGKITKI